MRILKFYTDTCQPCKMMTPILKAVVSELSGVIVEPINAVEQPEIVRKFDVTIVPTLVVIKDDNVVGVKSGLYSRPVLKSWLEELLDDRHNQRGCS